MSVTAVAQAALPIVLAGIATPTVLGGYKWLRAVSTAVGKLTEVSAQLGNVTEAQAEHARLIRSIRRELAVHVRDCQHQAAAEGREPFDGPDRRRVPRPRITEAQAAAS